MKKSTITDVKTPLNNVHKKRLFSHVTHRSLRDYLLTSFTVVLVLTVVSIMWYSYTRSSRAVLSLMEDLVSSASHVVIDRTSNYLLPASLMAEITAQVAGDTDFQKIIEQGRFESYQLQIIQGFDQLTMFNYGDKDGNFIQTRKLEDGTYLTKIINQTTTKPYELIKHKKKSGNLIDREKAENIEYDPRKRNWYIGAEQKKDTYWTDVYVFFSTNSPGISASHPILDNEGNVSGVISLDINLNKISELFEILGERISGTIFIMNENQELIAYPKLSFFMGKDGTNDDLVRIEELGIATISTAYETCLLTGQSKFIFKSGGKRYLGLFLPFPEEYGKNWKIGITVKEDSFVGQLKTANMIIVIISSIILLISIFLAMLIARSVSKPIGHLTDEITKIENFDFSKSIPLKSRIKEIQIIRDAIAVMKRGIEAFSKYVPSSLVHQLINSGEETRIGGTKRELTIMFSDITGFTRISEQLPSETVMHHLSDYLNTLTHIMIKHKGTVDKYIGDGILAFWGAPISDDNHAINACKTALQCKDILRELNDSWKHANKPPLPTRFGIHTGETVVGNIGSEERMNYSIIGDTVNVTSRIEELNKEFGTEILVTETTYKKVADMFVFRPLGEVMLRGRSEFIGVYELLAEKNTVLQEKFSQLVTEFTEAIDLFTQKQYQKALSLFSDISQNYPDDRLTQYFIVKCKQKLSSDNSTA